MPHGSKGFLRISFLPYIAFKRLILDTDQQLHTNTVKVKMHWVSFFSVLDNNPISQLAINCSCRLVGDLCVPFLNTILFCRLYSVILSSTAAFTPSGNRTILLSVPIFLNNEWTEAQTRVHTQINIGTKHAKAHAYKHRNSHKKRTSKTNKQTNIQARISENILMRTNAHTSI